MCAGTPASSVEVELDYARDRFRLSVRDDGRGIDQELCRGIGPRTFRHHGHARTGLQMQAKIAIFSREATGTELELVVPAAAAYQPTAWRGLKALQLRRRLHSTVWVTQEWEAVYIVQSRRPSGDLSAWATCARAIYLETEWQLSGGQFSMTTPLMAACRLRLVSRSRFGRARVPYLQQSAVRKSSRR